MSQEPLTLRPELLEGLKERNPNLELWWDCLLYTSDAADE